MVNKAVADDYDGSKFQSLRDADHIRKRPGMYIGDTTTHGLHHLVYELVYNSVDEALAGYCKNITVTIHSEGTLSVADDGRGIPVDIHPQSGLPTLQVAMTCTGTGAKFDKGSYKTSSGLHGMGTKAVTALSEWAEAVVRRQSRVYKQEYKQGKATTKVVDCGPGDGTGTRVTFRPDPTIFRDTEFSFDTLEGRLKELAFLNKGLVINLIDERSGKEVVFDYEGGIGEYVNFLNRSEDNLHPVIYLDKMVEGVRVEVAMQYTNGEEERVRCYTNNAYNPGGGTHLTGFRSAVTRTISGNMTNGKTAVKGEDCREGLTAVVSVQVSDPQFESNNKVRLNNQEVEGIVSTVVSEHFDKYLEENPKIAQKIFKKIDLAAQAREAAAKAKKDLKDRKNILAGGGLPGKLMDCTSRVSSETELFVVEGNSAGGSAESGRDRKFQAILPLRGKPLNVEKARREKMLLNEEIRSLISAIGIDIGNSESLDGLRYDKIVILADADVDGQHIRTLLLTFFYRQMQKLITNGHIYVARPPLFKVGKKGDVRYVNTIDEMSGELLERGVNGVSVKIGDRVFDGKNLEALVKIVKDIDGFIMPLERRGVGVFDLLKTAASDVLPVYRVDGDWMFNLDNAAGEVTEFNEVRAINRHVQKLGEFGLSVPDLIAPPRIAGRDPAPRITLKIGEQQKLLMHLRELPAEVSKVGEKGLTITRFKGLGEMDGEELWDTTLDPTRRTLMKVSMEDVMRAEELFEMLMGEEVSRRRRYIQSHALNVKDIDYHA